MFAHLSGVLAHKASTDIVIDCNGVGYKITVSLNTSAKLPLPGEKARVLTELVVREDAWSLFGFADEAEKLLFKKLTDVSGIGPKIAIGILSAMNPAEFAVAIAGGDIQSLQKLPGIGKKSAERLIVELRDKLDAIPTDAPEGGGSSSTSAAIRSEAIAALQTLGYSSPVAAKAVRDALAAEPDTAFSVEKLVRKALRCAR